MDVYLNWTTVKNQCKTTNRITVTVRINAQQQPTVRGIRSRYTNCWSEVAAANKTLRIKVVKLQFDDLISHRSGCGADGDWAELSRGQ